MAVLLYRTRRTLKEFVVNAYRSSHHQSTVCCKQDEDRMRQRDLRAMEESEQFLTQEKSHLSEESVVV